MSAHPATADPGGPGPYVVTFAVSFERMPLAVPFLHALDHFSAFRSHTVEQGRAVFRLHVGYYESPDAARAALRVVRRHYTDAHIATAPHRDLGSLDDTGITEFSMARRAPARAAASPARAASQCDDALQRYAIQLKALARADVPASGPDLEVFRGYTLYQVHVLLEDVLHQSLRLGFFPSVASIQQVLVHVRAAYPQAIIVPISEREYARVRDLDPRPAVPPAAGNAMTTGPIERTGRAARTIDRFPLDSGDDVSCEFGAHELPTADRAVPYEERRGTAPAVSLHRS